MTSDERKIANLLETLNNESLLDYFVFACYSDEGSNDSDDPADLTFTYN